MSKNGSHCDTSDVLNSSFYSSTSINTLDHAKTFRNSLILADISGQDYDSLTGQGSQLSEGVDDKEIKLVYEDKETATIKMSTSPSLSALAGILNEKSRKANGKLKSSELYGSSMMEDDGEMSELSPEGKKNNVMVPTDGGTSPNLFQLNDNEEVFCPGTNTSTNPFTSLQPDFLSSPEPGKNAFTQATEQKAGEQISVTKQRAARVPQTVEKTAAPKIEERPRAQRTVSATLPSEQIPQSKKKKNFFSFLKRRHSTDVLGVGNSGIPSSTTFSMSNSSSLSQFSPDRLTKKSYSSSNIFSTFKKNRESKKENEIHKEHHNRAQESASLLNQSIDFESRNQDLEKALPEKPRNDISKRKPTPLHYEHLHNDLEQSKEIVEPTAEPVPTAPREDVLAPGSSKLDTGEVLFPRSLDKHEVDSIVSIERSRSTKSNKRSSVASHRRSLTETLSINAHNEGMFVMEASSVVLSTPDLSKSPASSILRHGKFDPIDFSSTNSILQDDSIEQALSGIAIQDQLISSEPAQCQLSMSSIEEKLNQLTVESEEDENLTEHQPSSQNIDEDPEFMSDIMEFASIINFGEGVNFDFNSQADVLDTEPPTLKPSPTLTSTLVPKTEQAVMQNETLQPGLGISYSDVIHQESQTEAPIAPTEEEDEFENEDFNTLSELPQESPRLKAFMPDFEINRPLSMSFRGLKAPSFNASIAGSSATDSLRADRKSLASSERKPFNCVNFSSKIILYETYGEDEYDRKPDIATCNQLTPQLAQLIKAELNELKSDMEVHVESQCYTHFF